MKQTLVDGERNRALAILAEHPDGCTRAVMLGRGFPLALIASLIRAGLATDQIAKRIHGGPRAAAPVRITNAGRHALAEHEPAQHWLCPGEPVVRLGHAGCRPGFVRWLLTLAKVEQLSAVDLVVALPSADTSQSMNCWPSSFFTWGCFCGFTSMTRTG
jgi:hypothetical protein